MPNFKFMQCVNTVCNLRMPIDLNQYSGKFCPVCGEPMEFVTDPLGFMGSPGTSTQPKREMVVILDNLRSAYNVGAIFRTADGAGIKKLFLCGITPTPGNEAGLEKTALGAEDHVPWEYHPNALNLVEDRKSEGLQLIALERTVSSTPIFNFHPDRADQRVLALVVGNEKAGVDPGIMDLCEQVLAIPMMGGKGSLNVGVAFGIAAYWLSFV
ncbi:MAG: RNA methyltransferase [Brevefilum sp.]|nr:RNA methyltransferase [Brevefilum sp.]MDT8381779.1 RNA methyltransferase [Brevefilum sp.]MDW7755584.1 RNA methyltransferase [Brevefilum sp.]